MANRLIIDIGMHKCEDTDFYLHMGYKVVAIDANVDLVTAAKERYRKQIQDGSLIALNYALAEKDYGVVEFNVSDETLWSSIKPEVSNRLGIRSKKTDVTTRTLASIISEYGVPYYCKIDAAGYEYVCLDSLIDPALLPDYISVESECIGEGEILTDEAALQTLVKLQQLGYRQFKLVDQSTLSVLKLNRKFYFDSSTIKNSIIRRWNRIFVIMHQKRYLGKFKYAFKPSASGPFGEFLDGKWVDFETAKALLLRHRGDYFNRGGNTAKRSFSFWCDWHAKK